MRRASFLLASTALLGPACSPRSTAPPAGAAGTTTTTTTTILPDAAPAEDWAGKVVPRAPDVAHPGYVVVPGWPQLPAGMVVGEAVGVEVDSHNHVIFFHRADRGWGNTTTIDRDTVVVLDGDTGQVISTWGKDLFLVPHGLTLDAGDNVWLTDVGLSQVFQLTHDGQVRQVIGAGTACACPGAPLAFDQPTDAAVVPGGDVYVSDGYGNSRVAELTPAGQFVTAWGAEGILPGQLHLPHGIAFDQGRVYVADRANARIQVFGTSGALLDVWSGPSIGRPWGVAIGPSHHVFLVDGGDQIDASPSGRAVELTAGGALVTNWGSFGSAPGQMNAGHAISVGPDGSVYVVEQVGKRIQKFRPVP